LADLLIEMDHPSDVADYHRELDIQTGLVRVSYAVGDVRLRREVLISAVDDVLAVRLSADKPRSLRAKIRLTRQKDMIVRAAGQDRLLMDGQIVDVPAPEGYDDNSGGSGPGGEHMKFAGRLLVRTVGGSVKPDDDGLVIEGADEAVLLFTAATDFNLDKLCFDRAIDPGQKADAIIEKAARKSWSELLRDHEAEHRSYFDRVSLDLGRTPQDELPTDERLAALRGGGEDPGLVALYFQFGRYLPICRESGATGCGRRGRRTIT
jgi:alpha-L-fucosidase 2